MDLGNIIYLVAVIVYFIYQISKNKKSGEPMEEQGTPKESPKAPTTFEDLMREIREAQNPNRPKPAPKPIAQQVEVEEIKPEPIKKKWYEEADDEISYYDGAYEKAKTAAEKAIPISQLEFSEIGKQAYKKPEQKVNRYAQLMKDPQSVKDAVVLSEILNRKHF
ncbi:hypothetical protein V8V91_02370 [Algoriphagus halophilus]|uniref:hypothetical protein n=1 Tax=Algoriphagus halophilus TaxID=226505 RepID=UPI00358F3DBD